MKKRPPLLALLLVMVVSLISKAAVWIKEANEPVSVFSQFLRFGLLDGQKPIFLKDELVILHQAPVFQRI